MADKSADKAARTAVTPRVLVVGLVVTIALAIPFAIVLRFGGTYAAMMLGLGVVTAIGPALSLPPRSAIAMSFPVALAGAVAVELHGQPFAAASFVALCCVVAAPAGIYRQGLLTGLPTVTAVLVSVPGGQGAPQTAGWMLAGSALFVILVVAAKFQPGSAAGIAAPQAWRHAAVMAVSVGIVVYFVESYSIPHGYWVEVTLTVVLRPLPGSTRSRATQRIVGTVGGVILAVLLAWLLPPWVMTLALGASLLLMIVYVMIGDYGRQVMFMTPAVVLLAPAGGIGTIALERVVTTLLGALLAGALALLLDYVDSSATTEFGA